MPSDRPRGHRDPARPHRGRTRTGSLGHATIYFAPTGGHLINIRAGYEITYEFPKPTPMILVLNIHYSRASDLIRPDHMIVNPAVPVTAYRDGFGNWCARLVALPGKLTLTADAVVRDSGLWEQPLPDTWQHEVASLPEETLVFLLGSRSCETD